MDLASAAIHAAVRDVLARPVDVIAMVHAFAHPVTDELLARPDLALCAERSTIRTGCQGRRRYRLRG